MFCRSAPCAVASRDVACLRSQALFYAGAMHLVLLFY